MNDYAAFLLISMVAYVIDCGMYDNLPKRLEFPPPVLKDDLIFDIFYEIIFF